MNNFVLASQSIETPEEIDVTPDLRKRAKELAEIIGALRAIQGSSHWKLLEEAIWKPLVISLDKKLRNESDTQEIFRIQGQVRWAQKYAHLHNVEESFQKELQKIKVHLDAKNELRTAGIREAE